MEIHINGEPVAKVNGLSRSVSVRSDGGEITNFTVSPGARVINLVVEQATRSNAPRLDEIEFLEYLQAQEDGLLDGDGTDGDPTASVERISESEFTSEKEDTEDEETSEEEETPNEENKSPFSVGAPS